MICLTPTRIKNPKINGAFYAHKYIEVPCKKCSNCMKRRALEWVFRLNQENRRSLTAAFMTYTYDNAPISPNGLLTLDPRHHTLYMKRLRKDLKKHGYEPPMKYYMCGEYGAQTQRPLPCNIV